MTTPALRMHPRFKYLSLALTSAQRVLAFRRTMILNLIANSIWVVVAYYLWKAVFTAQPQIASFNWDQMRTYVLLAYAVNALLDTSYSMYRVFFLIRNGDIANELIRPFDFMGAQLALSLGSAMVEGLFSSLIALAIGLTLLQALPPVSILAAGIFLLSVVLGFIIKFEINFLVALLCFWTKNALGLIWAQSAVVNIFSGAIIPLAFFPDGLRLVSSLLPFQGIINTPLAVYLGNIQGWGILSALALQAGWILSLWLLIRKLWGPSLRALDIQGG